MATSKRTSLLWLLFSLLIACTTSWHITYSAAPLVMLFYNASLGICLWVAFLSGLLVDAVDLSPKFGFLALTYLVTAQLLYPVRLYFFKDSKATLPVMTFFFSFLAQCIQFAVALLLEIPIPKGLVDELMFQPFVDAFFALVVFMLPTFIWHQYRVRRTRRRYGPDS